MNWRERKVVVTGGAGFLGSHLCEALVARGARVTVVDDFSAGSSTNLAAISKDIEIIQHRLGDSQDGFGETPKADVLYHLAAMADPRKCREDFDGAFRANVVGLKDVLASWNKFERIVCLSSAAVYGDPEYLPIDENHPLRGKDPYAITKILGEWICKNYLENFYAPVSIVRNFNSYGPRQSSAYIIPTLIGQAVSRKRIEIWNSDSIRDFLFVSDAVEALLAIAVAPRAIGLTFNLGSGQGTSIGELVSKMANVFNVPMVDLGKPVTGSRALVCNNSKLKLLTGWTPKVTLDQGLRQTIEAFV